MKIHVFRFTLLYRSLENIILFFKVYYAYEGCIYVMKTVQKVILKFETLYFYVFECNLSLW